MAPKQNSISWPAVWQKVIAFLNSSLGIWFLSTVVVGVFTFCLSNIVEKATKQRKADESIITVRDELIHRLQTYQGEMQSLLESIKVRQGRSEFINAKDAIGCDTYFTKIKELYNETERPMVCTNSTLRDEGIISLLNRLENESTISSLGSSVETKIDIKEIRDAKIKWIKHGGNIFKGHLDAPPRESTTAKDYLEYAAKIAQQASNDIGDMLTKCQLK